jgi:energy-converting hydrogenase Eha subunit A
MSATPTITESGAQVRPASIRTLLLWMLSFLAIPIAGYLGTFLVGRVDNFSSALLGGALVGAIVGFAQALASRRRLNRLSWTVSTALGTSVGVALGTLAVSYRTSLAALIVAGLITGAVVGLAQALALPRMTAGLRWLWVPVTTILWALAWAVTTLAGVTVEEQFIVFGASGAFVYSLLAGLTLLVLRVPTSPKVHTGMNAQPER